MDSARSVGMEIIIADGLAIAEAATVAGGAKLVFPRKGMTVALMTVAPMPRGEGRLGNAQCR